MESKVGNENLEVEHKITFNLNNTKIAGCYKYFPQKEGLL